MRDEDRTRVRHMIEAAETALRFVAGRTRQDLGADQMLLFAVIRAVEILGEAASKVTADTRAEHGDIPWPAIVGMRNRLVHAYFDIDPDIVWDGGHEGDTRAAAALAGGGGRQLIAMTNQDRIGKVWTCRGRASRRSSSARWRP